MPPELVVRRRLLTPRAIIVASPFVCLSLVSPRRVRPGPVFSVTTPAWQNLQNLVARALKKLRESTALGGQVNPRRQRLLMSWKLGTLSVAEMFVFLKNMTWPRCLMWCVTLLVVLDGLATATGTTF